MMLPNRVKVFVANEPVDFRKTFDGLCGVVRDVLGEEPQSAALFVFRNRRADQIRILWWDRNFEFFYQFGDFYTDVSDNTIAAWSAASDTGYTLPETVLQPRIGLRANIISGDRNPNDNRLETFNPLFPKGKYFGELSPVAPYNLVHLNPYVRLKVSEKLQITGNTAFYRRQSNDDGIYSLGGSLIRSDGDTSSRYIGTQAEVLAEYQASRHLSILVSYSIFTAGDFIKATGAHDTIHFAGFESIYRF